MTTSLPFHRLPYYSIKLEISADSISSLSFYFSFFHHSIRPACGRCHVVAGCVAEAEGEKDRFSSLIKSTDASFRKVVIQNRRVAY